ncbi:hypothetical protein CXG81DRAFT_27971 [Caulochytrium protostelioides]|uniref:Uncharacterized protein n=1 Tax=Caulochytrium protostelioides TaxID=1555241 RepID=A0A4P9X090_9FUNG|nr:hypothetical protein CXG81DRAFT_27971 [Caulochytrium protostelioides]|eukprot:RKO99254.1 hypothetical protein CXG81DRAFT_27971 [Caulochytrium protostelioides]
MLAGSAPAWASSPHAARPGSSSEDARLGSQDGSTRAVARPHEPADRGDPQRYLADDLDDLDLDLDLDLDIARELPTAPGPWTPAPAPRRMPAPAAIETRSLKSAVRRAVGSDRPHAGSRARDGDGSGLDDSLAALDPDRIVSPDSLDAHRAFLAAFEQAMTPARGAPSRVTAPAAPAHAAAATSTGTARSTRLAHGWRPALHPKRDRHALTPTPDGGGPDALPVAPLRDDAIADEQDAGSDVDSDFASISALSAVMSDPAADMPIALHPDDLAALDHADAAADANGAVGGDAGARARAYAHAHADTGAHGSHHDARDASDGSADLDDPLDPDLSHWHDSSPASSQASLRAAPQAAAAAAAVAATERSYDRFDASASFSPPPSVNDSLLAPFRPRPASSAQQARHGADLYGSAGRAVDDDLPQGPHRVEGLTHLADLAGLTPVSEPGSAPGPARAPRPTSPASAGVVGVSDRTPRIMPREGHPDPHHDADVAMDLAMQLDLEFEVTGFGEMDLRDLDAANDVELLERLRSAPHLDAQKPDAAAAVIPSSSLDAAHRAKDGAERRALGSAEASAHSDAGWPLMVAPQQAHAVRAALADSADTDALPSTPAGRATVPPPVIAITPASDAAIDPALLRLTPSPVSSATTTSPRPTARLLSQFQRPGQPEDAGHAHGDHDGHAFRHGDGDFAELDSVVALLETSALAHHDRGIAGLPTPEEPSRDAGGAQTTRHALAWSDASDSHGPASGADVRHHTLAASTSSAMAHGEQLAALAETAAREQELAVLRARRGHLLETAAQLTRLRQACAAETQVLEAAVAARDRSIRELEAAVAERDQAIRELEAQRAAARENTAAEAAQAADAILVPLAVALRLPADAVADGTPVRLKRRLDAIHTLQNEAALRPMTPPPQPVPVATHTVGVATDPVMRPPSPPPPPPRPLGVDRATDPINPPATRDASAMSDLPPRMTRAVSPIPVSPPPLTRHAATCPRSPPARVTVGVATSPVATSLMPPTPMSPPMPDAAAVARLKQRYTRAYTQSVRALRNEHAMALDAAKTTYLATLKRLRDDVVASRARAQARMEHEWERRAAALWAAWRAEPRLAELSPEGLPLARSSHAAASAWSAAAPAGPQRILDERGSGEKADRPSAHRSPSPPRPRSSRPRFPLDTLGPWPASRVPRT